MLNETTQKNLEKLKNNSLVIDIETSSHFSDGSEINIRSNFEEYVDHAKVKWVGLFSYKNNETYLLDAQKDAQKILILIDEHDVLIGFNSTDFDFPILQNNGFIDSQKRYISVDCRVILGTPKGYTNDGFAFKNRGALMDYKFKRNSLKCMAETMKLETQKGDIDYAVFHKDVWTAEEESEIKKYLKGDILATKQMFDKLWGYWLPFAEFLDDKSIYNFSWLRNSIASLTYKSACHSLGVEPTYSDNKSKKEDMGGHVIEPKYEEKRDVFYVDFSSLYPHIMSMCNLFSEVDKDVYPNAWHGGKLFETKGYYDITHMNTLGKSVSERLKERIELKKTDKDNPKTHALKIYLNSLYGASRSSTFEKIHSPNIGWDTCWLGQQLQEFTEEMMLDFGFETIAGDTDSIFVVAKDKKDSNREYVRECLTNIVDIIKDNVPFPLDTFDIDIEHHVEYAMWPFSEQPVVDEETRKRLNKKVSDGYIEKVIDKKKHIIREDTGEVVKKGRSWLKKRTGKKKNYTFIYKDGEEYKLKIVGLPIKKSNATPLGMKIFNETLKPQILENKCAKFTKEYIASIIEQYLNNKEILNLLAIE